MVRSWYLANGAASEAHAVVDEGERLADVDLDLAEILDHEPLALHVEQLLELQVEAERGLALVRGEHVRRARGGGGQVELHLGDHLGRQLDGDDDALLLQRAAGDREARPWLGLGYAVGVWGWGMGYGVGVWGWGWGSGWGPGSGSGSGSG